MPATASTRLKHAKHRPSRVWGRTQDPVRPAINTSQWRGMSPQVFSLSPWPHLLGGERAGTKRNGREEKRETFLPSVCFFHATSELRTWFKLTNKTSCRALMWAPWYALLFSVGGMLHLGTKCYLRSDGGGSEPLGASGCFDSPEECERRKRTQRELINKEIINEIMK